MPPVWLRTTINTVEIAVAVILIALGGLILNEAIRLGPGWGEQGPQPGFFPFVLSAAMGIGALAVVYTALTGINRDWRPFFEASREVEDLLKVGVPIALVVVCISWFGLYVTSGLYIGLFMAMYGKFRWWQALIGAIAFPVILWFTLFKGFNIPMPMSMFYRSGILPF